MSPRMKKKLRETARFFFGGGVNSAFVPHFPQQLYTTGNMELNQNAVQLLILVQIEDHYEISLAANLHILTNE